jgi:hypothetical protein
MRHGTTAAREPIGSFQFSLWINGLHEPSGGRMELGRA